MRFLPVIAIALAFPTTASAQSAQELYERAELHFNVGEFQRALNLYREAYRLQPLVGLIVNVGRCHQQLGQYDRALAQYRTYLRQLPDAPNRADVERWIAECKTAQRAGVGQVPLFVYKERGPSRSGRRRVHRGWLWSGAVLGGALLATGAVTGALNRSMSEEYKDPLTSIPRRRELKDTGETLGVVSIATLAAGGAVTVATVVLYFYTDPGGGRRGSPGVTFSPLPGGATMVFGGSF